MRLLDRLSPYSFNLYYVMRKNLILADYLSQQRLADDDTSDSISISFHSFHLSLHYHGLDTQYITTRAQANDVGQAGPKVHGFDKGLGHHLKPKHNICHTKKAPPKCNVQSIARNLILRKY